MDRDGIKRLAEILDAEVKSAPPGSKWLNISCPFAPLGHHKNSVDSDPSFGVQINKHGVSPMYCFACGNSAPGLGELIMTLKQAGAKLDFKELNALAQAEFDGSEMPTFDDEDEKTGLFVFDEAWLESFPLAVNNGNALMYLAGRKGGPVPQSIAGMLQLRYDPFDRRVAFPIRGEDKRLYGLHGRNIDDTKQPRYHAYGYKKRRNPHVWLGSDTVDWNKPVLIAESVFDYARAKQVYRNTISGLHGDLSAEQLNGLTAAFEIVTLLDPDKTGDIGRKKIRKWAGKKRIVEHVILPNDLDAGATPAEELAHELSPYLTLDPFLL